jgi:hypothetical protein
VTTQRGEHMGSRALLGAIRHEHPRLVVCGHVHEGFGATGIGTYKQWTLVANVSVFSWDYRPAHRAVPLFDIPMSDRSLPVTRVRS